MITTYDAKAGQIKGPRLHTIEGGGENDKGSNERYVVWMALGPL